MSNNSDKLRVIVVDDDKEDIELLGLAFREVRIKIELTVFYDGTEVVEYLKNYDGEMPSILFLDLNMPKMGGLATLRKIRGMDRYKHLPIAIYSTSSSEMDIENTFRQGANIYIVKPGDFGKLKSAVSKVLKTQWHYETGALDINNYVMVVS